MRLGILGAGGMACVHAASAATLPGVRLAAVAAEEVTAPMKELLATLGAQELDVATLLEGGVVDAVVVATPTDTHAGLVKRALRAGLPVLCEKPLALDLGQAQEIAAVAGELGTKVAVGHVVRYFPEYSALRDLVVRGDLGAVATAHLVRTNSSPATLRPWYRDPGRSGGLLLDMGVHDVDWCLWALGPVRRVYAVSRGPAGSEIASVVLRHAGGAIASIDLSWRDSAFQTRAEVCGTEGMASAAGSSRAGFSLERAEEDAAGSSPGGLADSAGGLGARYVPAPSTSQPRPDDPYRRELEAALAWFSGGPPPLATLEDGLEAMRVTAAASESIRAGVAVEMDPVGR